MAEDEKQGDKNSGQCRPGPGVLPIGGRTTRGEDLGAERPGTGEHFFCRIADRSDAIRQRSDVKGRFTVRQVVA